MGIASVIDATILRADATKADIESLCEMANKYNTASVCINSYFIAQTKALLKESVKSCTVINFPLGSNSRKAVKKEAKAVLEAGVQELDMVQNIAAIKSQDWEMAWKPSKPLPSNVLKQKSC
jgi:deoxyribose-phosphate aldolase